MAYRIFISYAHKDAAFKEEFEEALRPLDCDGLVEPWSDRLIELSDAVPPP